MRAGSSPMYALVLLVNSCVCDQTLPCELMPPKYSHRTTAVSSPGIIRNFSPTWTTPDRILPDTPIPEDVAVCPLKTFAMGKRNGVSIARAGGSSLSNNEQVSISCSTGKSIQSTEEGH